MRTVICGASTSGKSTYLWANRDDDDLAVDFDRISEAFGNTHPHEAHGVIAEATFRARLSAIKLALESEDTSWIIHGCPDPDQISEYMAADAAFIVLDPGLEECLRRAEKDNRPEGTEQEIRDWYADPPTFPEEANVTVISDFSEENSMHLNKIMAKASRPWGTIDLPKALAAGEADTTAIVRIDGEIGWDTEAQSFARRIDELDVANLEVIINSPGGAAYDGVAIMNSLRRHKAKVTVTVDGLAASAASIIAMGGDRIIMNRGSEMMIHEAWGYSVGDASEMVKASEMLDKLSDSLADVYAARAGGTPDEWRDRMRAESWYTAQEAVEAGLADEAADKAAAKNHFDLTIFNHAGRAQAPAPRSSFPAPEPVIKGGKMPNLNAAVRERLGLTDADTDEAVLNALDEELTKPAADPVPAGAVMIDKEVLASLQSDAAAGREALEAQAAARRQGILAKALADGRIAPASKDAWAAQLEANEEGTETLLASLSPNTVPVIPIGHEMEPPAVAGDAAAVAKVAWPKEGE